MGVMNRTLRTVVRWVVPVCALAVCGASGLAADDPPTDVAAKGLPGEMILIPGGDFEMGSDGDGDHAPGHAVAIEPFYLDGFEVTNAEYHAFCLDTGRGLPEFWGMDEFRSGPEHPDHPVVGVSWYDAAAYAEWAGKRLPTEAEWEYAARGGLAGAAYPNGGELSPDDANFTKSGHGSPVAVGSYPPNGFGLHDVAGNVVEWVADWYSAEYYSASPSSNPTGPDEGKFRVIRGGGWHSGPGCNRVFFRNALPPNWRDINVGFRCARNASSP
jgi:formylglycine-generating enzyme required for sulfatase activity